MFHYLFTNDLRISKLDEVLYKAAYHYANNTRPEDKSEANNLTTLGFYFNLTSTSNCTNAAKNKKIRKVVLNFIKKFQFPNLRTTESFSNAKNDRIILAPMRSIVKLLHSFNLNDGDDAYLTTEEIKHFIFYNKMIAKSKIENYSALYNEIKKYRESNVLPDFVEQDDENINWRQEDRQLREMLKTLEWAGCATNFGSDKYKLTYKNLSKNEKSDIFDIIMYNEFWDGNSLQDYQKYMDLSENWEEEYATELAVIPTSKTSISVSDMLLKEKDNFINLNSEIDNLYKAFNEMFSPDNLRKLEGQDLLDTMFISEEKNINNLCYWLEYHSNCRSLFGSISGGSSYKYDLFYSKEHNSWVTGSAVKPIILSQTEAIKIAEKIRNALVEGADIINNISNFNSLEDYIYLEKEIKNKIGKYSNNMWVIKYFHMIFPEVFSTCYAENLQKHILFSLAINPSDTMYKRSGQIAIYAKSLNISNALFAKAAFALFGKVKNFSRIGTSDKTNNFFYDWKVNSYVGIGWPELGEIEQYRNKKDLLQERLIELYYPSDKRTASRKSNEILSFLETQKNCSYVVTMDGRKLLALGEIVGDYYYDEYKALGNCKKVNWIKFFGPKDQLPSEEGKARLTTFVELEDNENLLYLYNIIRNKDSEIDIASLEENKIMKTNCTEIKRTPKTEDKPLNFIIYGAPGTGKTYSTVEHAMSIIEKRNPNFSEQSQAQRQELITSYKEQIKNGQIVFTTFHQNYCYEDFIQGLRPDISEKDMSFNITDGVFKKIADKAISDHENNYVIIIDEINRANISKVFGELITLIEEDKRWGEINESCATLQSGDIFAVPNNLYIVGTMNSADKSISLIDAALRRRFEFIEQKPDASLIKDAVLKNVLLKLNNKLVSELDSTDLLVGHSYFFNKTEKDLCNILNNNIIPLLYEYFYDNRKKIASLINDIIKDISLEMQSEAIGRIRVKFSEKV